jgi:hypothetical protein
MVRIGGNMVKNWREHYKDWREHGKNWREHVKELEGTR